MFTIWKNRIAVLETIGGDSNAILALLFVGGAMSKFYNGASEKEKTMRLRRSNLSNPYYVNMMKDLARINTPFALGLIDFFNAQHRLTLKQRAAAEKTIAAFKKANS